MVQTFAAQVEAWVRSVPERALAVRNEAAQRTVDIMQAPVGGGGSMPIDTGFLRASLRGFVGNVYGMPAIKPDRVSVTYSEGAVAMVIANAGIDDTLSFIYLAAYAKRVNYGFVGQDSLGRQYNQAGRHFVDKAAQQWPRIVSEVVRELKGRLP